MKTEIRYSELRQDGRVLTGTAIRYGDIATLPWGQEKFLSGAFGPVVHADVILNSQHDRSTPLARTGGGGLMLTDSPNSLVIRAELPETQAGLDVLELVRKKVLRGLSIEFHATAEQQENDLRIVEQATLTGVSVVDNPAYPSSTVEARAKKGASGFKSKIPYEQILECHCHRGECNQVRITKKAFDEALQSDDEILVIHGDYSKALGSRKRGTLRLKGTGDGMDIEMDLPDTQAGKDLAAAHAAVPLVMRPYFDQDASDFTEVDGVAEYKKMKLRAILIGATDASKGWPEAKMIGKPKSEPKKRDRKIWL